MQPAIQLYSREEYLTLAETSETKYEFFRGEIFAMSGGTFNHSFIKGNIFIKLGQKLNGKPCHPMDSDMRLRTPSGLNTYPDISIYCGMPELTDAQTTLLNPCIIVEVLSPSTSHYDRGNKFNHYRSLVTLTDYVLVESTIRWVEHRQLTEAGEWQVRTYSELTDVILFRKLEISLTLAEIYAEVLD
jgi:Uma2 family endonuclease